MKSTAKHSGAFERYWRMGAGRSIERLHAELESAGEAPTLRTLHEWSRRHHWQDRIVELERQAQRAEDDARVSAMREVYDRQAKEALLLQQKGTEWLAAMRPEGGTAEDGIRAVVEGARLERLARGEPSERQEVQGEVGVSARLASMSDDELDRLIKHAEGTLGREGEAEPR